MSIHVKKMSLIHVAKTAIGMDDDAYRAMLLRVAGVQSSKELHEDSFAAVMAEFERLGFRSVRSLTQGSTREGFATPAQIGRIRSLWKAHTGADDERALSAWLFKKFKVSNIRFLERDRAGAAVAILQRIVRWPRASQIDQRSPAG